MSEQEQVPEKKRRDWLIILIILLFGLMCVIIAGGWAIRFAPTWKLGTNMGSNLDPNSDFLTNRPSEFLEPLDPSILTQPAWINVFLTPGASFETVAPVTVLPTNTPLATNTARPAAIISPTVIIPSPTNTLFYYPPPTNTPRPTLPQVDLQITKTDGATTYIAGSTVTYTIVVTNNGPNNVTGATINDNIPAQVTSWNWVCAAIVNAGGCDAALGSTSNFTDTVNIQNGGSITYTVTANINAGATGNLVNTASVSIPAGYTDTNNGNNLATDTDTTTLTADLQITKTDNHEAYLPGATKTYTIVVSNAGPSNVTGATVTDTFSTNANIASASWTCVGSGGSTCTAIGSGDVNDSVNLPSGSSITYTVTVNASASPSGNLVNTATVTEPGSITDPVPGNNSATDTDELVVADTQPGQIGTTSDGSYYQLTTGGVLTLNIPVVANGDAAYDLVIYEFDNGGTVYMDWIEVQIGDGSNWYTVFYWGDNAGNGAADTNSNINFNNFPALTPPEPDERPLTTATYFYNGPGIQIDIDIPTVSAGTYPYIRIIAPPGDTDGTEIDGIEILP